MRQTLTPPEARLWAALRRQQMGVKFRRQHPIGPYIIDFFCASLKLAIEVDGTSHGSEEAAAHDARRTLWLASQGIEVIRIAAIDVRMNFSGVVDGLRGVIGDRITAPSVTAQAPRHLPTRGEEMR
jgi:very-short-patch-repair endonuclease